VCAFDSVDAAREFLLELRRRLCVRRLPRGLYSLHPFVAETARQVQTHGHHGFDAQSSPARRHIVHYSELLQAHGGYEWNIERYPSLIFEERELVHAVDAVAALSEREKRSESQALRVKCAEMTSLISWYLHWRGHWDLRIRLCERVCAWAEQKLLLRMHSDTPAIVGNLYVDQGWIHLHRDNVAQAQRCALRGSDWLRASGDLIFATELAGQVALQTRDYAGAVKTFESLQDQAREGSRVWLVFSYRLADALQESGDRVQSIALLESLLQRVEASTGQHIEDVRARIRYRVAMCRRAADRFGEAIALAQQATAGFAKSGIITPERRLAVILLADLLKQSGRQDESRQFLIKVQEQAEKEGDFEMLNIVRHRG
jgi:tetratricopeptide (TPR) repeat protein